jgi:hypothetical protein
MIDIQNPELLRYVRSELRPARVATILGGTYLGAFLLALVVSAGNEQYHLNRVQYWRDVYSGVFIVSTIVLLLWTLINSSQAVVGERTHRTFDFWRTTRLSPMTLAVGKLTGAPIGAWLQYAAAVPILLFTGILGGYSTVATVGSLLVIALFNLALGSMALCLSMRAHDSRRSTMLTLVMALIVLPNLGMRMMPYGGDSGVSAWSALSPAGGVLAWLDGVVLRVILFGHEVPSLLVTIALSLVVIGWCLTALVRSVKMEPEQRSLFSPLQVVGVSASLLAFVYAAFQPHRDFPDATLNQLIASGLGATLLCMYFTVVSTLFSRDSLRQQLRSVSAGPILSRLIAPWVATGLIGLLAAVLALAGYRQALDGNPVPWTGLVGAFLLITAYAVRDGMFLQWMISQRVKMPALKGMVLLVCYYVASVVIAVIMVGPERMGQMLRWLAPISSDPSRLQEASLLLTVATLVPPVATTALLASGVLRKMQRAESRVASPANA